MLAVRDPLSGKSGSSYPPQKLLLIGQAGAQRDALAQVLAQLGIPLEVGADGPLPPDAEVVLIAESELPALLGSCTRVRLASPGVALLCCWLAPGEHGLGLEQGAQAAHDLLSAGADDLLLGIPDLPVILVRLVAASRARAARQAAERGTTYSLALHQVLDTLSAGMAASSGGKGRENSGLLLTPQSDGVPVPMPMTDPREPRGLLRTFHQIMAQVTSALGWTRAALVLVDEEMNTLTLVAASEEVDPVQLPVGPQQYQELRSALRKGEPAIVRAARERSLLSNVVLGRRPGSQSRPFSGSLLILPLSDLNAPQTQDRATEVQNTSLGWAMLLSHDTPQGLPDEPSREFLALCAQITALGLRGRHVIELLRDKTRRFNLQRYAAERRREAVLQYREFFESSADGMMVLDSGGKVVYLNRSAEQMTGYAAAGLSGRPILPFIPENQREGLTEAVRQVLQQVPLLPFDLQLVTTSGETLVLSVSTSSALAEHDCAVLSFRDVTEQRILEHELRKTKEFLERLIDSTVDGIISADMDGNIILFNRGATRISGYPPDEVIGKLPVWRLYPEGEARRIMAQLRSGEHGGPGRLLQSRRTIVGKQGVAVPVSLSASIIYEDGREVATVGVVSDLRERISIEQRLHKAQEMLVQSEKQVLIAELAGTAAHELNQPLTSVMGYAGLLRRKLNGDVAELLEFLDIIVRESERMAEIVRKIGRITRYETKPYVGESRIIDLDKSAVPEQAVDGDTYVDFGVDSGVDSSEETGPGPLPEKGDG